MLNGIQVNIKNTVDARQIQKFMDQTDVNILVGFPSGMEHVPTWHKKDKKKKNSYEGYHGEEPENIAPIETAVLAKELHYGTAEIPARPFLEDGVRQNIGKLKAAMKDEVTKIKDGGKANWNKVGIIKQNIRRH